MASGDASAPAFPILTGEFLDTLEEKAFDYDDGAEIAEMYGPTLAHMYETREEPHFDQAGKILGICARNNVLAASHLADTVPDLPKHLRLDKRSMLLLSALVSTPPGRTLVTSAGALETLREQLGEITPAFTASARPLASGVSSVLRTLGSAGENLDSQEWCRWVAALQQAFFVTKEPQFKQLAADIVDHQAEFSDLGVKCSAQPGLLDAEAERKRAAETEQAMPNPLAARNHFDL